MIKNYINFDNQETYKSKADKIRDYLEKQFIPIYNGNEHKEYIIPDYNNNKYIYFFFNYSNNISYLYCSDYKCGGRGKVDMRNMRFKLMHEHTLLINQHNYYDKISSKNN